MGTCKYYLDMDSFYSMAYRLSVAPVILNDVGVVISVPRAAQIKHVKKWMNIMDVGELDYPTITVTHQQRKEFSGIMKSIYFVVRKFSSEKVKPFMVDGMIFTAYPECIPELKDRVNEVAGLPFTIGCGDSISEAIRSCGILKQRGTHE